MYVFVCKCEWNNFLVTSVHVCKQTPMNYSEISWCCPTSSSLEVRDPVVFTWGFHCSSHECLFTGKRCLRDPSEKFQRDPVQHPVAHLQMPVSGKRQDSANTSKRNLGVCKQEDSRGRETDRQGQRLLAAGKEQRNSTERRLPFYPREEVR